MSNQLNLDKVIKNIVDENSGGIKMTALVTEVVATACKIKAPVPTVDEIEAAIEKHPDLNTITYTHHQAHRQKIFVFTP